MQVTNLVDKTEIYSLEVYLEIAKVDGLIILSFQPNLSLSVCQKVLRGTQVKSLPGHPFP